MKRKLLVALPLLLVIALLAWLLRPKHESLGDAYISERDVTLWSSIAQVREPMDTLHYGDHIDVIARRNDNVKIRTVSGEVGWVDGRLLLEPVLWRKSVKLLQDSLGIPVQAWGRTKVQTNLRVEPGRNEHRLYQFGRGVPVEIVKRASADWTQGSEEHEQGSDPQSAKKKEDWLLVRAIATRSPGDAAARTAESNSTTQPGDQTVPIAGWVIGRFIELDPPDPVRDGMASANVRTVAWFELNRVPAGSDTKPQYLAAGARGAEGQPCDFTTLRAYTWDAKKSRYETAYIENNLCGQMPVIVGKDAKGEPEFRFRTLDGGKEPRVYHLIQTLVRRVPQAGDQPRKPSAHAAKRSTR